MDVLLLNASEEVLDIIDWTRAVSLLFTNKAEKPWRGCNHYKIKTTSGYYELPMVIVLREFVHVPYFRSKAPSKRNVYKRDGNRCQYCGCSLNSKNSSIDHILPSSRGGKSTWQNLAAACKPCNKRKGNRTPEEAGMPLLRETFTPTKQAMMVANIRNLGRCEDWLSYLNT